MPTSDELIIKALNDRAETVTADGLRYPVFPADQLGHRHPSTRRFANRALILAAASVVAVLAIAIGGYVLRPDGHHRIPASGGVPSTMLVGKHWHLSAVRTATRTYSVPADYRAELSFAADGRVSGLDGLNALAGTYRISTNKIIIRITAVGTAGSTETFPAQEAMASVYMPTSLSSDSATSTYTLTPETLTLNTGRWTVTFSAQTSEQPMPATITPRTSSPAASPSTGTSTAT